MSVDRPRDYSRPTLLYVDDQPSHRALFQKAFQGDYQVITAASGEEAIEMIGDINVFMMIADHHMPRMSGLEFLRKAREISPRAVQAILSAYSGDKEVEEAVRMARIAGYLKKPWRRDEIKGLIETALRGFFGEGPSQPASPISHERARATLQRVIGLIDHFENGRVDRHGARRIFLNHVEPPLRPHVPLIRCPTPILLEKANGAAIRGDFAKIQEALARYIEEEDSVLLRPVN